MSDRVILFGAFDRHNFGDLLFPHVVGRLLAGRPFELAGLAERDLRPWGGHHVKSLAAIGRDENAALVHCGGELLTCTAYQAAVMLQSPAQAGQAIAQYDAAPDAGARWARTVLQTPRALPYVAPPNGGTAIFNAVGGVEWPLLGAAARAEVIAALQQASWVSVRDRVTQAHLRSGGITAPLCPDPAVMVRACFDDRIGQHRRQGEVADVIRAAPQGHIACQFSADFGDDHTLDQLARGLRGVCARTGLGLVLFRAGAAPWHDQLDPYERLRQRLPAGQAHVFRSLHLWDICALIASARAYCGSSLHGAVVAMAHGLSHVSLLAPQSAGRRGKVAAYLETWEPESVAMCVKVEEVERALIEALAQSAVRREQRATELVQQYQASQLRWMAGLT